MLQGCHRFQCGKDAFVLGEPASIEKLLHGLSFGTDGAVIGVGVHGAMNHRSMPDLIASLDRDVTKPATAKIDALKVQMPERIGGGSLLKGSSLTCGRQTAAGDSGTDGGIIAVPPIEPNITDETAGDPMV